MRFASIICLLLGLAAVCSPSHAQEWTRFRGPNGTGQSDAANIPTTWTQDEVNWKLDLPGVGQSSPVLWGNKLFVTSADASTGTQSIFCVDATNGKLLWQRDFKFKPHRVHTQNTLASSTPCCDANRVYMAWGGPDEFVLLALDHEGKDQWRIDLGKYISQHGFGTSPIVHDDTVFITNEQDGPSFVIAVDAGTGKERWKVPRKNVDQQNASYATPMIYDRNGQTELIINSWAHGVSSLDPGTGRTNWEIPVFERRPVGSPILANGLILGNCGEGGGSNSVIAVRPPDAQSAKPEVAFEIGKTSAPYVPTLIEHDKHIFLWGDRGIVTCIDSTDGKVVWRERVGGNYSSSPIRIGERIFNVSSDGEVTVLAASSEFKVLGRTALNDATRSTLAVANGTLYLRTHGTLLAVGGK
ncbi:MAG: PQQ-binding-like beta-propeller repeat protein [Planctomycetota bacterium]|nr:PQQ-binding-like beta-propeller repeat protein [Planctomycetota bacterium]